MQQTSKANFLKVHSYLLSDKSDSAASLSDNISFDDEDDYHNFNFTYDIRSSSLSKIYSQRASLEEHEKTARERYVKIREHNSIKYNEKEDEGYLTDRIVEACSSSLNRSPRPGKFILTTCNLSRKGLINIDLLSMHQYFHKLDLSRNQLESLDALNYLPFLTYLDVSHNQIPDLLNFKPPINLSYVNFSYNLVEEMVDLAGFWSLVYLDVSHNLITKIWGLDQLKYLNYLDLSTNRIECLENLNSLSLQTLYLDFNNICDFEKDRTCGLHTNYCLLNVSISNNKLTSLALFEGLTVVEYINASNNEVSELVEILNLNLVHLMSVDLQGNPVSEISKYRQICLNTVINLRVLDGAAISPTEKGNIVYKHLEDREKLARMSSSLMEILVNTKSPEIDSSIVPYYQKHTSLLILVGPLASRKKDFISLFKRERADNKFIKIGLSYTTRPRSAHESEGREYYFVTEEEFVNLILHGKLVCYVKKFGFFYGIGYDEVRKVSKDTHVMVFHTDLTSALEIRAKYHNCKLLLCTARSEKNYKSWLHQKYKCTDWIERITNIYSIYYNSLIKVRKTSDNEHYSEIMKYMESMRRDDEEEEDESDGVIVKEDYMEEIPEYPAVMPPYKQSKRESYSSKYTGSHRPSLATSLSKKERAVSFSYDVTMLPKYSDTSQSNKSTSSEGHRGASKGYWRNQKDQSLDTTCKPADSVTYKDTCFLNSVNNCNHEETLSVSQERLMHSQEDFVLSAMSMSKTTQNSQSVTSTDSKSECVSDILNEARNSRSSQFVLHRPSVPPETGGLFADLSFDYFVDEQLEKRITYLEIHIKNPGLFYTLIFTDEEDEAVETLEKVLRSCVELQRKYVNDYKPPKVVSKEMRQQKINMMFDIMKN